LELGLKRLDLLCQRPDLLIALLLHDLELLIALLLHGLELLGQRLQLRLNSRIGRGIRDLTERPTECGGRRKERAAPSRCEKRST
jgi:hypothetical protein